jgi:hypothetical protein
MITWIPYTGYGTVEQRENPPPKQKFHTKGDSSDFFINKKGLETTIPPPAHVCSVYTRTHTHAHTHTRVYVPRRIEKAEKYKGLLQHCSKKKRITATL